MTETTLRTIGGAFQLTGVLIVAAGVWQTRRGFTNRAGLVGSLAAAGRSALARIRQIIPQRRREQTVAVGLASEVQAASGVSAKLTSRFEGLTFEEMRTKLESLLNVFQREIDRTRQIINEEAARQAHGLESERQAREAADHALLERLQTLRGIEPPLGGRRRRLLPLGNRPHHVGSRSRSSPQLSQSRALSGPDLVH